MSKVFKQCSAFLCALSSAFLTLVSPATAHESRIAVLDFGTHGLTSNWWGDFQPGVALSDLVTDQLVNTNRFIVIDRQSLDATMQEHSLSASGLISPATAVQEGRLLGARYLITGNILQFDRTGGTSIGGGGGGFLHHMGGPFGAIAGNAGLSSQTVTLRVQVRVIDVQTSQIVASFSDEQSKKNSSFDLGGFGVGGATIGGGSYHNEKFMSSTMGHLINDEAMRIAQNIKPEKFQNANANDPTVHGRILGIDGANIILNIGAKRGVEIGQFFDVIKTHSYKDPDSGRIIVSNESIGKIQITQVFNDSAVGQRISGNVQSGLYVQSEQ